MVDEEDRQAYLHRIGLVVHRWDWQIISFGLKPRALLMRSSTLVLRPSAVPAEISTCNTIDCSAIYMNTLWGV